MNLSAINRAQDLVERLSTIDSAGFASPADLEGSSYLESSQHHQDVPPDGHDGAGDGHTDGPATPAATDADEDGGRAGG